jgi:hypothetical protein
MWFRNSPHASPPFRIEQTYHYITQLVATKENFILVTANTQPVWVRLLVSFHRETEKASYSSVWICISFNSTLMKFQMTVLQAQWDAWFSSYDSECISKVHVNNNRILWPSDMTSLLCIYMYILERSVSSTRPWKHKVSTIFVIRIERYTPNRSPHNF